MTTPAPEIPELLDDVEAAVDDAEMAVRFDIRPTVSV